MTRHRGAFLRIQGFTTDLYSLLSPIPLCVSLQLRLNLLPSVVQAAGPAADGEVILYTKMHFLFKAALEFTGNLVATQGLIQRL